MAYSATQDLGFSPLERPRIAIASDGTLAAIHEATRVSVIELPGGAAFAEVGIAPEAVDSECAWVGAPPRLLVLSRYSAHSTVHLLDPYGPRTIAEIRLEAPMRLCATVGPHALAVGPIGAAVLTASDTHLTPYQFPARAVPVAAGAAAAQFVVALSGTIEEWDPQSRMPKRRIKLQRTGAIRSVGGSDRVVWWTTQGDPRRIDVSPLVNRGQPKWHELPEPIAHVTSHPRSDLIACVGAESGRVYVVDLDGRAGLRVIGPEGIDRAEAAGLVVGRFVGVLVAQAGRPVALVSLERRDPGDGPSDAVVQVAPPPVHDDEPAKPSTLFGEEVATSVQLSGMAGEPAAPPARTPPAPAPRARPQAVAVPAPRPAGGSHPVSGAALAQRMSAWRDRLRDGAAVEPPPPVAPVEPPAPSAAAVAEPGDVASWRDAVATWARAVVAGAGDRDAPAVPPLDLLLARFALVAELQPALVLLYGAHLAGEPGAAPVEVARVLGGRWDEALGRGQLAAAGVAVYRDSRVRLHPVVVRVLDELPPRTGTLVGAPGPVRLAGPCVLVAPEGALGPIAEACVPSVGGAILAAHPDADPRELLLEARALGAVAMLRVTAGALARLAPADRAVLVALDEATADQLGVPRLV